MLASGADKDVPPWPGRLPPPAPATVLPESLAAAVYDATGQPVTVSARLAVSAPLASIAIGPTSGGSGPGGGPGPGGKPGPAPGRPGRGSGPGAAELMEITGWGGPWPVDERWWAPGEARRQALFQATLADGRAVLLALTAGRWTVEAIYD